MIMEKSFREWPLPASAEGKLMSGKSTRGDLFLQITVILNEN